MYEGTYCELREPHCAACGSTKKDDGSSASRLFQCSRCGVVHYCGVECQKKDFVRHKKECRDIQRIKDKLEQEAEPLKHFSQWGEEPSNLFETSVGDFWVRFRSERLCFWDDFSHGACCRHPNRACSKHATICASAWH